MFLVYTTERVLAEKLTAGVTHSAEIEEVLPLGAGSEANRKPNLAAFL